MSSSNNINIIENLALRQQLFTYKAKNIKPAIKDRDRFFWIALKKSWSKWTDTLIIVKTETAMDFFVIPTVNFTIIKLLGKTVLLNAGFYQPEMTCSIT